MFYLLDVVCSGVGGEGITIPDKFVNIIQTLVDVLKIGVPLLLIIFGMLDMGKAVMAQKEDEIKKGQQTLIKRAIAAAIVFFVVSLAQLIVSLVANDDDVWNCVACIIGVNNEDCQGATADTNDDDTNDDDDAAANS